MLPSMKMEWVVLKDITVRAVLSPLRSVCEIRCCKNMSAASGRQVISTEFASEGGNQVGYHNAVGRRNMGQGDVLWKQWEEEIY